MGKTFDQLDAIDALADADLFVVDDDSGSDTNKMTPLQLITYLESKQLDGLQLNEAVALAATSTEINTACDGVTATATEINNGCDGIGVSIPRTKILTIGDWDMNATGSVNVAHGLDFDKIIGWTVTVRNDANDAKYRLEGDTGTAGAEGYSYLSGSNIALTRNTGGQFDNSLYDSTSYNRGWVVVFYID